MVESVIYGVVKICQNVLRGGTMKFPVAETELPAGGSDCGLVFDIDWVRVPSNRDLVICCRSVFRQLKTKDKPDEIPLRN
jgi:hypothetical protein